MYGEIADIFNIMAETGEYPREIKTGVLVPLQKPGKPKGPVENLRPIILLSVLQKILAICMLERINDKIDDNIPNPRLSSRSQPTGLEFLNSPVISETILGFCDQNPQDFRLNVAWWAILTNLQPHSYRRSANRQEGGLAERPRLPVLLNQKRE